MLILSGQRKSQVALARLEDFDFYERTWTIPLEQQGTKSDDAHVLPITAEIEAIVKACPHERGYLFSTTGGDKPLTLGDKLKKKVDQLALEELRLQAKDRGDDPAGVQLQPWTVHDLRRTMRTGLSSLAIPEGDCPRTRHRPQAERRSRDLRRASVSGREEDRAGIVGGEATFNRRTGPNLTQVSRV